jgi:methionine-rich copper-binding protein CopC
MRHRLRVPIICLTLSIAVASFARASALHLHLEKSEPSDSAVVTAQPAALKLWFSEPTQAALTKITLTRGADTIPLARLTRGSEAKAPTVATIARPLVAGAYVVSWRTMGKDGHAVNGTFRFSYRPIPTDDAGH